MSGEDASDANAENDPNQIRPKVQRVLAPVAVTERSRGEQQAREDDGVRVDDPLEIGARRAELVDDGRHATLSTVLSIPMTTTQSDKHAQRPPTP